MRNNKSLCDGIRKTRERAEKMTRIKCYEYVKMGEKKLIFNFSTFKAGGEGQIK